MFGDGPIKTFSLRGVKDNPPYLHDERLLTLDDTIEFFNLGPRHQTDAGGKTRPAAIPSRALASFPSRTANQFAMGEPPSGDSIRDDAGKWVSRGKCASPPGDGKC